MQIPAISMALANVKTANEVGMAMLGKAMDQNEIQGAGLVNMIDAAAMERSSLWTTHTVRTLPFLRRACTL